MRFFVSKVLDHENLIAQIPEKVHWIT